MSSSSHTAHDVEVSELDEQDAAEVFDGICRLEMGISGREFLRRWDAGQYDVPVDDVRGLADVVGSMPLVR